MSGVNNRSFVYLSYIHLFCNVLTIAFVTYGTFNITRIFCNDLNNQFMEYYDRIQEDIETCTHNFFSNHCFPVEFQTKFMAQYCSAWEKCKNQDPRQIHKTRLIAESVARVINTFVETMSWKALVSQISN
ncbi:Brl1/Brr6 domain-containing protein [Phakopsora pachyrhizi]|nr:Brl1/Brr6 domain-containing protein [Phakopsora pachyrhizi]